MQNLAFMFKWDSVAEAGVSNNLPVFEGTSIPGLKRRGYSNFAPSEQCRFGKQQPFPAQFALPCPKRIHYCLNIFFRAGVYTTGYHITASSELKPNNNDNKETTTTRNPELATRNMQPATLFSPLPLIPVVQQWKVFSEIVQFGVVDFKSLNCWFVAQVSGKPFCIN